MLIGKLALQSGLSRGTIRYYEKLGLISADNIDRSQNNYKNYQSTVVSNLAQFSQLKMLGFTLSEITALLESFEGNEPPVLDYLKS